MWVGGRAGVAKITVLRLVNTQDMTVSVVCSSVSLVLFSLLTDLVVEEVGGGGRTLGTIH